MEIIEIFNFRMYVNKEDAEVIRKRIEDVFVLSNLLGYRIEKFITSSGRSNNFAIDFYLGKDYTDYTFGLYFETNGRQRIFKDAYINKSIWYKGDKKHNVIKAGEESLEFMFDELISWF